MLNKAKKSLGQNFLIDHNVLKQIVDTVNITYFGNEVCNYIQERNSIDKSLFIHSTSKFVTSVYYKSIADKKDAEKLFERLKNL